MFRDYEALRQKLVSLRTPSEFMNMSAEIKLPGACCEKIFVCAEKEKIYALKTTLTDGEYLKFLHNEYKKTRRIKHPNIRSAAHRPASGSLYSVLPLHFVEGVELFAIIEQETDSHEIPKPEIPELYEKALNRRYLTTAMLRGLAYLHKHGITHNDVKPDNVLVGAKSLDTIQRDKTVVKWCDFGFSFGRSEVGGYVGSEGYLCPAKCAQTEPLTTATDIFAFGMLFFALCCGLQPITQENSPRRLRTQAALFAPLEQLIRKFENPYVGLLYYKEPRELFLAASRLKANERATAAELLKLPFFKTETLTEGSPFVSRHAVLKRLEN